jgi:hypothetical protein
MKKTKRPEKAVALRLNREAIRVLTDVALTGIPGGAVTPLSPADECHVGEP